MLGFTLAAPSREGVWIGTWTLYRVARRVLPTAVLDGRGQRAKVDFIGGGLQVSRIRPEIGRSARLLRPLRHLTRLPRVGSADAGVFRLDPGGVRAVVAVEGPSGDAVGEQHARWCAAP